MRYLQYLCYLALPLAVHYGGPEARWIIIAACVAVLIKPGSLPHPAVPYPAVPYPARVMSIVVALAACITGTHWLLLAAVVAAVTRCEVEFGAVEMEGGHEH